METSTTSNSSFETELTAAATSFLRESAKWSKFLAIMGFIGIGLMVLGAIFSLISFAAIGNEMGSLMPYPPMIFPVLYFIMAGIYFMPIYYLYNYATKIPQAFDSKNKAVLTEAFENLKSHHKFLGIATIVIISLYILLILGFLLFFVGSTSVF